jgi:hypothetical protein
MFYVSFHAIHYPSISEFNYFASLYCRIIALRIMSVADLEIYTPGGALTIKLDREEIYWF